MITGEPYWGGIPMDHTVTQEMRDRVKLVVDNAIERMGCTDWGQFELTDSLILLIHNDKKRYENGEPSIGIKDFVSLLNESCEEELVHEYVVLKEHLRPDESMSTKTMLLRGLHRHERNREWMDPADPDSVQRNTVLLKATVLLRRIGYEQLADEALDYGDSFKSKQRDRGLRDAECVDLILDYPEHYESLINAMLERGYRNGMDAFREMMTTSTPALNNGVL